MYYLLALVLEGNINPMNKYSLIERSNKLFNSEYSMFICIMRKLFIYFYGCYKDSIKYSQLGSIHFQGETGNDCLNLIYITQVFVFGILLRNIRFNNYYCMHLVYLRY